MRASDEFQDQSWYERLEKKRGKKNQKIIQPVSDSRIHIK